MKIAKIRTRLVLKMFGNTSTDNYRSMITLSNLILLLNFSKAFFLLQLNGYMEDKFSKCLMDFRENHSTQNSLLKMIEFWKASLKNG